MTTEAKTETVAAEAEQQQGQPTGAQPDGATPAKTDTAQEIAAELEAARTQIEELKRDNQRYKSIDGAQRSRQRDSERMDGLERGVRRLTTLLDAYIESGGDAEQTKAKEAQFTEEERKATQAQRFNARVEKIGGKMRAKLTAMGLTLDDERVKGLHERWQAAVNENDSEALLDISGDLDDVLSEERTARSKKDTEKAVKEATDRLNAENEAKLKEFGVMPETVPGTAGGNANETFDRSRLDPSQTNPKDMKKILAGAKEQEAASAK